MKVKNTSLTLDYVILNFLVSMATDYYLSIIMEITVIVTVHMHQGLT